MGVGYQGDSGTQPLLPQTQESRPAAPLPTNPAVQARRPESYPQAPGSHVYFPARDMTVPSSPGRRW